MPVLIALALALMVMLAAIALMPLSLIQRYRMGTSRRLARPWIIGLNMWGMFFSTCLFLASAGMTSIWVPGAFTYALSGITAGCLLGFAGLALTVWERGPSSLHYTPNRWLVLALTMVVSARLLYGFWRGWEAWGAAADGRTWLVTSGVAGSLAAGGMVLAYYLVYWAGVRSRAKGTGTWSGGRR